jgi:alpha-ketoglutarate-dependent 2,4-dichlorophenoxyacetate dioxygenase
MTVEARQLHPLFAAEITGVDTSKPTPELRATIERMMDQYGVCVLPGQNIDARQQVDFAKLFGVLENPPRVRGSRGARSAKFPPEIFPITNLTEEGDIQKEDDAARAYRLANALWHTDSTFRQTGATYSMLHACVVPPHGADTQFVDTRAAYDQLSPAMKAKLEGLEAVHSIWESRGKLGGYEPTAEERIARPPAHHPLVKINPNTGRRSLLIAAHVSHVIGWPEAEGRALIVELMDHATRPRMIFSHEWRVGDMVIWDNRCTMHRATPFEDSKYVRDLRRVTVREYAAA